jgi:hypothetical protein
MSHKVPGVGPSEENGGGVKYSSIEAEWWRKKKEEAMDASSFDLSRKWLAV